MNYDELTAKELRELCEKRGIKPSRAKADMIENLQARDAADELSRIGQELEQDGVEASVPTVEEPTAPEVPVETVKPAESQPEAPEDHAWVEGGTFYKTYPRNGRPSDREHQSYLEGVVEAAVAHGRDPYGPPFRDRTTDRSVWLYGVNVR